MMFCKMAKSHVARAAQRSPKRQARIFALLGVCCFILAANQQQTGQAATPTARNTSNLQKPEQNLLTKASIDSKLAASDDIFETAASNDEPELDTEADSNDSEPGESSEGSDEPAQSPQQLAAQKEREAAEAREADAANRAALDEQQAQQDRIIQAQSRAEAQAVIDQRNALSRQQDTLMQGQLSELDEPRLQRGQQQQWAAQSKRNANYANVRGNYHQLHQQQRQASKNQNDIQFSDHDSSFRRQRKAAAAAAHNNRNSELEVGASDLVPAAQYHHNYGSHYGSLHKHQHGKYYQFAESHKKGQYKAGFKRGNKKFHISGHSSQHKSHADGYVKWHSKKGKGSHHWDYKHKDKKHYKHHY